VLCEPARTLQFASISFDASFQELFTVWGSGGGLVLVDELVRRGWGGRGAAWVRREAEALGELLVREQVARLFVPFVALQQLAEQARGRPADTWALREVITAGEQLQ